MYKMLKAVEYIWQDAQFVFRSKVRYMETDTTTTMDELPIWNFDGSSTGQATTENSEVLLVPVALYHDKSDQTRLYVLCETYVYDSSHARVPHSTNRRHGLAATIKYNPWFGFEQEFFIEYLDGSGYVGSSESPQGPYYCNVQPVNDHTSRLREATEAIAARCVDLGLGITGWNLEVAPGQTEIQIFGHGIRACDDLIMMRYLAYRVLATIRMRPVFSCKPRGSDLNGSGLHTNFSNDLTRDTDSGYDTMRAYFAKLGDRHGAHMAVYGTDNHLRLTGLHETSSMSTFTVGVGSRSSSVRIPHDVDIKKFGYFEDRRPAADADPYQIASVYMETLHGCGCGDTSFHAM